MGVCSSNDDRSKKYREKHQNNDSIIEIKKPIVGTSNNQNMQKEFIFNRLSDRTKFTNINNEYSISERILGKGATGIVREGQDKNGVKYAIKTVWKSDIEKNEYFKKEIDISLELSHESIIKCYEVYEDNNALHFVLEEITGGDLFDHIIHSEGRKLTELEAMDLLSQMLEGLHYLHGVMGIVHRDIKPENYLLFNDGQRIKVKLIDFGFATYCRDDETMNEQLGTPQYAAPEIFELKPYNSKVDLWSLGIVLYNMVKGTQPFSNVEFEKIKEQVLNKEINYSGFQNNELKNLCQNLLERNPDNRYSAFQAMKELEIIKTGNTNMDTCVKTFKPNMHKIMFILYNDRTIIEELKNIFLTECTPEQLSNMSEEILSLNSKERSHNIDVLDMVSEKLYLKAEKLIEYAENSKYASENLKTRLKNYCEQKVINKIKKQMINVDNFFNTLLGSIKFIRKVRCLNEFQKLDKDNLGWINIQQMENYFIDPLKRHNIKTRLNKNDKVSFETFYNIYKEYNGIKNFK